MLNIFSKKKKTDKYVHKKKLKCIFDKKIKNKQTETYFPTPQNHFFFKPNKWVLTKTKNSMFSNIWFLKTLSLFIFPQNPTKPLFLNFLKKRDTFRHGFSNDDDYNDYDYDAHPSFSIYSERPASGRLQNY